MIGKAKISGHWLGLLGLAALTCCAQSPRAPSVQALYRSGDLESAAQAAHEQVEAATSQDRLVYLFQEAGIQRDAGHPDVSKEVFTAAEDTIEANRQEAKVRDSQRALHFLVDTADPDYLGRAYERIMLYTY